MSGDRSLTDRVAAAAAAWVWVPPDAQEVVTPVCHLVLYPWRPCVVSSCAAGPVADLVAEVEATVLGLRPDQAELDWWVDQRTRPGDTADRLRELGFADCLESDVLGADLAPAPLQDLLAALAPPAGVEVRPVDDEDGLLLAGRIVAEAFDEPPPTAAVVADQLRLLREDERTGVRRGRQFVAHLDGEPVAAAGATIADGALRMWGTGVLPAARRRGAYRALVAERLRFGADHGARLAVVRARTTTSSPILRRAGMVHVDREVLLRRPIGG